MHLKHPIVLFCVLFWIVLAIWPSLLLGRGPRKQNPATLRIALLILALANFAFWYFTP
ncbi:MAG TPA: hypothetical protein VLW54_13830 [Candidatus Acidoferrales bacterium]|nr:hypothetical protein [Candidatus Acidoferrales bacterium]